MKQWYVVHTLTGQEDKVKLTLETRSKESAAGSLIGQVMIPTEQVSEVRSGKKRISTRKFFPGYVLVEMEMTDESWYLVKSAPGVTGFVGAGTRPTALSEGEIHSIQQQAEEKREKPVPKVVFTKGEAVKIIEGPFTNFNGAILDINPERGKLRVNVSIFGRSTPVELEYWQVEKQ